MKQCLQCENIFSINYSIKDIHSCTMQVIFIPCPFRILKLFSIPLVCCSSYNVFLLEKEKVFLSLISNSLRLLASMILINSNAKDNMINHRPMLLLPILYKYCMWQHINYDILLSAITLFKDSYIISLVILSPIILVSFPDKLAKAAASTLYDTAALYITG